MHINCEGADQAPFFFVWSTALTDLTLLHTAEVHVEAFNRLAPDANLTHVVRPDWLQRAQGGIGPDLKTEISKTIEAAQGMVLCTCTTLGAVAEEAGATRIDWPMMQKAAEIGGPVLLVYCLESTRLPSTDLLERAFAETGACSELRNLPLTDLWPLFSGGDTAAFHKEIASCIAVALTQAPDISCVVLAQASMAGAAHLVDTHGPVLTSPETAIASLMSDL